ncbi:MAG: glycogen debranching enzyme N-terminal domain-containing protein [Bryobacteraceae bacterium]
MTATIAETQSETILISAGKAEQATLEETLIVEGARFLLDGDRHPLDFRIEPVPTWIYQVAGIEVEQRVIAWPGERTAVIEYELFGIDHDPLPQCVLEVRMNAYNVRRFDLSRCTRATVVLPGESE